MQLHKCGIAQNFLALESFAKRVPTYALQISGNRKKR
jgi:hypothetical protein